MVLQFFFVIMRKMNVLTLSKKDKRFNTLPLLIIRPYENAESRQIFVDSLYCRYKISFTSLQKTDKIIVTPAPAKKNRFWFTIGII